MQNKYQKMMEHVEVNDEMHERLMQRVADTYAEADGRKHTWVLWKKYIPVFAVLVIAIAGVGIYQHNQNNEMVQAPTGTNEYQTRTELEQAVGFVVEEAEQFPFIVEKTTYTCIDGNLAQIDYEGQQDSMTFRKSQGTEDNSGDFATYDKEDVMQCETWNVMCKGDENGYTLVTWNDGTYQYSFTSSQGYAWSDWEKIIKQLGDSYD